MDGPMPAVETCRIASDNLIPDIISPSDDAVSDQNSPEDDKTDNDDNDDNDIDTNSTDFLPPATTEKNPENDESTTPSKNSNENDSSNSGDTLPPNNNLDAPDGNSNNVTVPNGNDKTDDKDDTNTDNTDNNISNDKNEENSNTNDEDDEDEISDNNSTGTEISPENEDNSSATSEAKDIEDPRLRFVEIVKGEYGTKEAKYNNVKYNTWFYGKKVSGSSSNTARYSWCITFICWCANQAGISTDIIPKIGSSESLRDFYIQRGLYESRKNASPKVGDIVFFGGSSASHGGVVVAVTESGVQVMEGNCANMVKLMTYKFGDSSIMGYASPDYYGSAQ